MDRDRIPAESSEPLNDLALWELHAYCLGALRPPAPLVRDGDNGRLLNALHYGLPAPPADPARIDDLRRMRLVEPFHDGVRPAFPVIGPSASPLLRRHSRALAERCLPRLIEPVARIRDLLAARRLADSTFAIVFGHALDGLTWSILACHGAVPDTRLTADRPYWNGTFWAIWPPRKDPAGVNEAAFPGMTLVMVWTSGTEGHLKALARRPGLESVLRSIAAGSAPAFSPDVDGQWVIDPDGRPRIPIIRPGDALDLQSRALARPVAEALLSEPLPVIERARDPRDARTVLGHELIWDLADLLHVNGLVPRNTSWNRNVFLRLESDWTQPRDRSIIGT